MILTQFPCTRVLCNISILGENTIIHVSSSHTWLRHYFNYRTNNTEDKNVQFTMLHVRPGNPMRFQNYFVKIYWQVSLVKLHTVGLHRFCVD